MKKCITVLIPKPRPSRKIAPEPVQLVEAEVENAMETEMHNVEQSNDVDPINEHEEPNNDSNHNANNEDLIPMFAQNAMQFSKPNNNLSIEGSVCGKKFSFLVDTGAIVSAIKADVWRQLPPPTKHPPEPTRIKTIRAVNGQNISVLGQVEIPFEIQAKIYPYRALIIQDLAYDAILGRDFLEQYEAKIDLKANVLDLEDRPSSFSKINVDNKTPIVCFAIAQSSFILPPESETIVPAVLSEPHAPGLTGIVNPRAELPERYQIMGAAEIVTTSQTGTISIRLLNPTSQPVKIIVKQG